MKRRMLCALIILALLLSLFPTGILAAETGGGGSVINGEYVAVVNTSLDEKSTGTLVFDDGVKAASAAAVSSEGTESDLFPMNDVVMPEEESPSKTQGKGLFGISPKAAYGVGDAKKIGKIDAVCIGVSDKAYIWMEKGLKAEYDAAGKTDLAAKDMASVYEGKPYETLMALSGGETKFPYRDNSGKLSIVIENTSSTGYYGSEPDITAIHVKADPAASYKNGNYAKYNGLLAHEGQHALFHLMICGGDAWLSSEMLWLNEGLSVAAMDYVWGGSDPTGWLSRINNSSLLREGSSLVYGNGYRGNTAQDYSMPYLFVRYLADQKAQGYNPLDFYKTFYTQKAEKGKMPAYFEKVMANQTGVPKNLETALEQFYTAAVAQENTGVYGFYNDQTVREAVTDYPIYRGESGRPVKLAGTAAIIIKTKDKKFTVPTDGDTAIKYIAFDQQGAQLPGGSGTAADPYRIKTAADLSALTYESDAFFRLENDLDVTDAVTFTVPVFSGSLDGGGHTIKGLSKALCSENKGTISNLKIENFKGEESSWSGILSNFNYGAITDCVVTGTVDMRLTSTSPLYLPYFGTLTGENQLVGTIERCYSDAAITVNLPENTGAVGALVGNNAGKIKNSYTQGALTVVQSGAKGNIAVGGIAGKQSSSYFPYPSMTNAYSTAVVTVKADAGVQNVARLVGQAAANSTFNSCYALEGIKAVNGNETLGAVSKTEAEMKTQATYKDWAFNSIWQMSSSYPEFYIPKSGAIQVEMPNTTYYTGEKLNLFNGYLVINGTKIEMTENMLAPFDSTTAGEKTVTGSYKGVPFSFKVTVKAPGVVTELTVNKAAKVDYIEGQFFDQTGAVLMATIDGSPYHYLYSGFSVNQTEALKPSDKSVTYTYGGATVSQAINVTPKTVAGISVIQRPEVKAGGYYVGDKLELTGLRAQLIYNDGSQSEVMAFDTLEAAGIHVSHQLDTTLDLTNLPNLKETDNGTSLYVYYGDKKPSESGAVYAEIMKLEVKKGLWLDDQVVEMSVGVDSTGIKTEAVEGGSGRYKVELKSGQYPKGITKNDVWLPGHSGTNDYKFTFYGKPETLGEEQTLIYTITDDVPGGQSIDVKITIKIVPKSSYCELLQFNFDAGWNKGKLSQDVVGVVGKDTVSVVVPSDTDVTDLTATLGYDQFKTRPTDKFMNGTTHNFTTPVVYEMLAEDGTIGQYTVTVTKAEASAKVLNAPTNLKWDNGMATWDKVEGAQGYAIELYRSDKGEVDRTILNKYAAADNSFDFSEILPKKDNYSFKVFAVGDGKTTLNSAHSAESPVFSFTGPYVYKVSITTPPGTLKKGSTQQLTAALQGVGAFNEAVIWSISGQNNADTKILPDGTLNIAQNETAAMITVKAASVSNTDQYAEADIQLEDIPKLALPEELKWSDKTAVWKAVDGAKGYSLTLYKNREAVGSDVTAAEATYNFEETIKKTGAGDYTFRVTAQGDGVNALDSDPVESPVYNYKETPTVESVTVTPSTATLKKGETQEFTAVVNGKNTPSQEVEWTLEGQKSNATTITKAGKLTIGSDESATAIKVIATSIQDNTQKGEAAVTITEIPKLAAPANLSWNNKTAQWDNVEKAEGYSVELYCNGVKVQEATAVTTTTYDFSSNIVESGTYTFRVTTQGDGVNYASSDQVISPGYVYEQKPEVTAVSITPKTVTLKQGANQIFTAAVTGVGNFDKTVSFAISGQKSSKTVINDKGELTLGEDETAESITVTVLSKMDNTKKDTAEVTVKALTKVEKTQKAIDALPSADAITEANKPQVRVETAKAKAQFDALSLQEKAELKPESLKNMDDVILALGNIRAEIKATGVKLQAKGLGLLATADEIAGAIPVTFELIAERQDRTADEALIYELAKNKKTKVGELYTLQLIKTTVGQESTALTTLQNPIEITLEIPEAFREKEAYEIIRVHQGKAEALETIRNNNQLMVKTDQFSTYAFIFKEKEVVLPPTPTPTPGTEQPDGSTTQNTTSQKGTAPNTGTTASIIVVGALLILAGTALVVRKINKDKA